MPLTDTVNNSVPVVHMDMLRAIPTWRYAFTQATSYWSFLICSDRCHKLRPLDDHDPRALATRVHRQAPPTRVLPLPVIGTYHLHLLPFRPLFPVLFPISLLMLRLFLLNLPLWFLLSSPLPRSHPHPQLSLLLLLFLLASLPPRLLL